jgi:hypothetical protein
MISRMVGYYATDPPAAKIFVRADSETSQFETVTAVEMFPVPKILTPFFASRGETNPAVTNVSGFTNVIAVN